jgi:hypothetical protein
MLTPDKREVAAAQAFGRPMPYVFVVTDIQR